MIKEIELSCSPEEAKNEYFLEKLIRKQFKLGENIALEFRWKRRSIDARSKHIKIRGVLLLGIEENLPRLGRIIDFKNVQNASKTVHIIGAGPAGLFAALQCIELGIKPILFDRGKDVRERRRDLAILNKTGKINPESNYCFGEGGAGTYSDGKLYTRSKKRGDVEKVLHLFVQFGAKEDILIDAHPHIGTNKLPQIISSIREFILQNGGEIHFNSKLTDLEIDKNLIRSIEINNSEKVKVQKVLLATGHSARDVYFLLDHRNIKLEAKSFALGVRVEHSQDLIDQIQYKGRLNDDFLPPASYNLVAQIEDRGVYSFCMCPGGIIAPCATEEGEVVTNGWSPSKRNNPYSNSGIVVGIYPSDFKDVSNPFVCLNFQREIEQKSFIMGGSRQKVPAQRLLDFIENKKSIDFPKTSYQPGITSINLNDIFPEFVHERLRKAFIEYGTKMPGYLTNDAVLHAPESRTSSPISIPRCKDKFHHVDIKNLYPCAEGAGYAGGIVSAAIDGMNCITKIQENLDYKTN